MKRKPRRKARRLTGWLALGYGLFLTAFGIALLLRLSGEKAAVEPMDMADRLLIFPVFAKLFAAIFEELALEILRVCGIVFVVSGVSSVIFGTVSVIRTKKKQRREREDTLQKLRALYDDGALTDEEYRELADRTMKNV